jgi:hypothetical protein
MSDADDQLGGTGGERGKPPSKVQPQRDNAAPSPEEAAEASSGTEEEVRNIPPGPGAPMQQGENR